MGFAQRGVLALLAAVYVAAGLNHFANEDFYVAVTLPFLPWPRSLVRAIGLLELGLGLGLLFPELRRQSALGLIGLVGAQLPGSLWVAVCDMTGLGPWNWARIPVQAVLIAWTWLYGRGPRTTAVAG